MTNEVTLDKAGRIVIPKLVRERYGSVSITDLLDREREKRLGDLCR
jgi:bifunctional DNA-binding transcriptional regulator/antitoxin component of YhaV-PrlF toxin-antitoxin module